jgi:hypothetical protein
MICVVDQNNKIINIVNADSPTRENERIYYPWSSLWEQYTDVEPLKYAKQRKLSEVSRWTASNITGGFVSSASGESVRYDSDKETQLTMQGITLNVSTPLLAAKYPNGCPVRGYKDGEEEKTIQYLNASQVLQWMADLSMHIGSCKQAGWAKQAEVDACKSVDEVNAITLGGDESVPSE